MLAFASFPGIGQPVTSLREQVGRAYSLVGRWEIIKMEVDRYKEVNNPNTVPETSMGVVSVLVKSELGSFGHFTVAPGGAITGEGEVQYSYRIAAGTSAFSWGPVNLPIGATAMMHNEDGLRRFRISGNADLSARTISLNAFQPQGGPLGMIIRPGGKTFTSVLWPPMTNIAATKIIVNGSSMLLRASGVLSGIKVSFEAVKYVDLASVFEGLETYIDNRVTTIITNTSHTGGANNPPNTGAGNTNNTTGPVTNTGNGGSSFAPIAGSVNLAYGGSARVVFSRPLTTANYSVSLTPMNTGDQYPVLTFSDKTPAGFRVHAGGGGSGTVKADWLVTPVNN